MQMHEKRRSLITIYYPVLFDVTILLRTYKKKCTLFESMPTEGDCEALSKIKRDGNNYVSTNSERTPFPAQCVPFH